MIILVPKVENPTTFKRLRLVSMCNFANKIISKLLVVRLSPILPSLISLGFVQDRMIHYNILLVQELMRSIRKKSEGIQYCTEIMIL